MTQGLAVAIFGSFMATNFVEATTDVSRLDEAGWWAVTQTFEGEFQAFRFTDIEPINLEKLADLGHDLSHNSIAVQNWTSSMSKSEYVGAVESIRQDIARGWVYQANLCRVLSAPIDADLNVQTLNETPNQGNLPLNAIANVTINLADPLCYQVYKQNRKTGSFILINENTNNTVAAGVIRS